MDVKTDEGPCKLLFVSRRNLPQIVAMLAPDLLLVDRARFTEIATSMLDLVDAVAKNST